MAYYQPTITYKGKSKGNSVARYLALRIKKHKNNYIIINDFNRRNENLKVSSAISICKIMNDTDKKPFYIVYSIKELKDLKLKNGDKIIFLPVNKSEIKKVITYISSFVNTNMTFFFCPSEMNIEMNKNRLFNAEFKIIDYNKKKNIIKLKPRFLEYNKLMKDFYYKRLIVNEKIKGKRNIYKLNHWNIPLKDSIQIYELKKKKFTTDLNNKLLKEIQNRKLKHKDTLIFDEAGIYEKRKKMANKRFKQRQRLLRGLKY